MFQITITNKNKFWMDEVWRIYLSQSLEHSKYSINGYLKIMSIRTIVKTRKFCVFPPNSIKSYIAMLFV
jgi:hypothetical protein